MIRYDRFMLRLTREVRFGIDSEPAPSDGSNGHAGRPALAAFGSFLTLRVTVRGQPDPDSGYLLNIKQIDDEVRRRAIPVLGESVRSSVSVPPARALLDVAALLRNAWRPVQLHGLELHLSPYLSFGWTDSEPHMIRLSQKFEFSASHRLHNPALSAAENVELFGKCNNPHGHGHNYELQVTVVGEPDAKTGRVMALADLERIVDQQVIHLLDHKHLNVEVPQFKDRNPSVENIARVIYTQLASALNQAGSKLDKVTVWETPKTWAEYSGES